ncbi:biotin synthase BioB [Bordetella genomosp. 13]|uniref:Biotin synthase n=2 Tax=Bordetella genomosp. 13 TaxID=463040 RepID=A0A1W6Z967_9BORD|nr:biotin synthase BioB [Bordetella genomosp. 13]ARP93958.1 biotin synthase BioB [Bordetella genomosp. 13]
MPSMPLAKSSDAAPDAPATESVWQTDHLLALYELPLPELLYRAQSVHRQHFPPDTVQLSTLLSIKTGGCPEDCGYCPQSARHDTGLPAQALLPLDEVLRAAQAARDSGATRFCMGAAWRSPKPHQVEAVAEMVKQVKALGLETCVTLGMLRDGQAEQLKEAGLDYYNHNLDTSPEFYGSIVSTRTYRDRLDTLQRVREAGISVCCGGIVGMGESRRVRAALIAQLAGLRPYPESVPINGLVAIPGTPLAQAEPLDPFELVRTVAVARIAMPRAMVRLSAGREALADAGQALCFLAGANSIFYGDVLLTAANPQAESDRRLLARLGMRAGDTQPSTEAVCR